MSSTLDRLKALNDKLEVKLSQKTSIEAGELHNTSASPASTEKKSTKTPSKAEEPKVKEVEDYNSLAKKIVIQLAVDEDTEGTRVKNLYRIAELYQKLNIDEKAPDFTKIFIYKAMNISGIGLKEEDFGEIREGKYTQIIAITYEPDKNGKKKAKNISLSYFGKAEKIEEILKNEIIEFVLRWRYEKAFQNLEHYKELLYRVKQSD